MTGPAGWNAEQRRRQPAALGAHAVLGPRLVPPSWRPCAGSSTGYPSSRKRAGGAAATRARRSATRLPLSAESTLPPLTSMVASLVRSAPVSGTATRAISVRLRSSPREATTASAVSLSPSRRGGRALPQTAVPDVSHPVDGSLTRRQVRAGRSGRQTGRETGAIPSCCSLRPKSNGR